MVCDGVCWLPIPFWRSDPLYWHQVACMEAFQAIAVVLTSFSTWFHTFLWLLTSFPGQWSWHRNSKTRRQIYYPLPPGTSCHSSPLWLLIVNSQTGKYEVIFYFSFFYTSTNNSHKILLFFLASFVKCCFFLLQHAKPNSSYHTWNIASSPAHSFLFTNDLSGMDTQTYTWYMERSGYYLALRKNNAFWDFDRFKIFWIPKDSTYLLFITQYIFLHQGKFPF